jgi:hypothetical protein
MEIFADCIWSSPSLVAYAADPAELFCGEASPDRGGWDELRCFDVAGNPELPRCYGRRGAYWVGPAAAAHYANGLFGTCELDSDGSLPEVAPEEVCACEGACP